MSDLVELTAGQWGHGGVCVARLDGCVVLLRLALPGERVLARVTQRRAKFWRAEVVKVLAASPDRVAHPWPAGQAAGVGGMDLAHVAPAAARAAKAQVISEQLSHTLGKAAPVADIALGDAGSSSWRSLPASAVGTDGRDGLSQSRVGESVELGATSSTLSVEVRPVGSGDPLGWRTRLDLVAGADGRLGMHRSRSNQPVLVDGAPMAVPAIGELGLFGRRFAPGRVMAVAPSNGPAFVVGQDQVAPRRDEVVHLADGREWRYSLDGRGFWQAHYLAPATLVTEVLRRVGRLSGAVVWDLYCGAGLFTLPLAEGVGADGQVVGVESGRQAVADATANLAGLDQVQLIRANVAGFTARTTQRPDVVVLDPPRAGAGPEVVQALVDLAPPRVVYVSCEVSTLARDLAGLAAGGYQVTEVTGYDLFPGTWHAEIITTLTR